MASPAALVHRRRHRSAEEIRLRRVTVVWYLLFMNVLQSPSDGLLHIPHRVAQLVTQGCLMGALALALMTNSKCKVRAVGVFLTLYSILAISALMMSIRLISVGTAYRSVRMVLFLAVLWLLTPWWGNHTLVLLKSHMRFMGIIFLSVVLGLFVSPNRALPGHRLSGAIWTIPATQVAHYLAVLVGATILLWLCRMVSRRRALIVVLPGAVALIATHTRTAAVAMIIALLVASLSLFGGHRRVRRAFAVALIAVVVVGLPLSSLVASWAARGQSTAQISHLSGRTKAWALVFAEPRPETNRVFGSGISNGGVAYQPDPALDGLPIDSSWILTYQDEGLVGDILEVAMFLVLLIRAFMQPRSPTRALALFLIIYCLIASFTESGMGLASPYLLDLTVAASLLAIPSRPGEQSSAPIWA